MTRLTRGLILATLLGMLGACGATRVESTPPTTAAGATTTTPTGTVEELLARLDVRTFQLGLAIIDGRGGLALAEIEGLWAAAAAQLPRTRFVDRVEGQIELMRTAVERRRAADADKAARNISVLIEAR